ncbi:MAG: L-serine ammonia-lyase, iron-sulfur-dependent, subunit alpha [Phycisphaerae bacterium]|nr:L-serine ammonia-lyase, iron-sulfur-dependent, subunit alpha [Phycisphaerae bacterium]
MESIRELYRIGTGPSSSHTMGPRKAAEQFGGKHADTSRFRVTLYGSLAATGKGHLTDVVVAEALSPAPVEFVWKPNEELPGHPNGLRFEALDAAGAMLASWQGYSIGGGSLRGEGETPTPKTSAYDLNAMKDILAWSEETGQALWEYVELREGTEIRSFLRDVWHVMQASVERGIHAEGVLPGGLGLARKAWSFYRKAHEAGTHLRRTGLLSAYALAAAEENAAGGLIVTAPTCGSCGVVPSVLRFLKETVDCGEGSILRGLATAGLIGNLVKHNASISGAEVGCQGEIGTACAMAAGAAVQLLGGAARQAEYAAEMALEHHMGLTCDPVAGLVQIPCIERNAFAAARAMTCAQYALLSDGSHRIPFDEVVTVMRQTGHDLPSLYRETASGGLAAAYRERGKS